MIEYEVLKRICCFEILIEVRLAFMNIIRINIRSCTNQKDDLISLFKIVNRIRADPEHSFNFHFDECQNLECGAIAILGAIANFVNCVYKDKQKNFDSFNIKTIVVKKIGVAFKSDTMLPDLYDKLGECNFLQHFIPLKNQKYQKCPTAEYIGFRIHEIKDDEKLIHHIGYEWITDDKLSISQDLRKDITRNIYEIFQNAFGHGIKSSTHKIDVISCGSYNTENQTLSLCIVDLGIGIADNVKKYLNQKNLTPEECVKWALQVGNSTQTDSINSDMARGLGLDVLKEFITINKGSLDIYTNTCHIFLNNDSTDYNTELIDTNFPGTMVLITINCSKEISYSYSSESDDFFK